MKKTANRVNFSVTIPTAVADVFPPKNGESTQAQMVKYLNNKLIKDGYIAFDGSQLIFKKAVK